MAKTIDYACEYKLLNGWHLSHFKDTASEARAWMFRVDEAGGHHHARRFRAVKKSSNTYAMMLEELLQSA